MTPEPPLTANQQPVIILKKQPKILAPDEIRARKNSMEHERQEKAKAVAKAASMDASGTDPMILKNEAVRKAAEKFEKSGAVEESNSPGQQGRSQCCREIALLQYHKSFNIVRGNWFQN